MQDALRKRLDAIERRMQARREQHKADVVYMKAHHPDIADWLTEFASLFGKGQINYRVTIKHY